MMFFPLKPAAARFSRVSFRLKPSVRQEDYGWGLGITALPVRTHLLLGTGAAATWDRDPGRFGGFGTNSPCYGPWRQHACQIRGKITIQFEIMKFVRKTNPSRFALLFGLWDVNARLKGFVLRFN